MFKLTNEKVSRRAVLEGLVGAAAAWSLPLHAQAPALEKASLRFHWTWLGVMAPVFLGMERGFYKDAGIDLSIGEGRGSGTTVKMVANGNDTFAWADSGALVLARTRGVPIKQVMTFAMNTLCCVWIDGRIKFDSAQDLIGKRIGSAAGDGNDQLFPAVLAANNIRPDQVQKINLDPSAKVAALGEGRIDVLLGGTPGEPVALRLAGLPAKTMLYAEMGVGTLGQGLSVNPSTIANQPELVRHMVRATKLSWLAAIDDPKAALDAMVLKVEKRVRPEFLRMGLEAIMKVRLVQPNFGWTPPEKMEATLDLMKKYSGVSTQEAATEFYTNEFV